MTAVARHPLALVAQSTKNMIANSNTFIKKRGAADYKDAKQYILIAEVDANSLKKYDRPLAVVFPPNGRVQTRRFGHFSGQIQFGVEMDTAEANKSNASMALFEAANFMAGIQSDISVLGSTLNPVQNDADLIMSSISLLDLDRSMEQDIEGGESSDFWRGIFEIEYGLS